MKTFICATCNRQVELPDDEIAALVEALGSKPLCEPCFDDWCAKQAVSPPKEPEVVLYKGKYEFKPEMGEITGMGGSYEQATRNMVAAGCEWLDAHPNADVKLRVYKNIFGVVADTQTEDTRALSEVIGKSVPGCSSAMHQAAFNHVLYVKEHGWDAYCQEMQEMQEMSKAESQA